MIKIEKDYKKHSDNELVDLCKWTYNLMLLDICLGVTNLIADWERFIIIYDNNERIKDLLNDYKLLQRETIVKMDISIRSLLDKKGISIMQNTYKIFGYGISKYRF